MKKEKPTKQEMEAALRDFDKAANLLHKKMNIIQPFFALYMKHGKVMAWLAATKNEHNG